MTLREYLLILLIIAVFSSCSSTPVELVAKHTRRGDEYLKQGKLPEAIIEYKNAVKAGPKDVSLHYKLARAALESKDIRTAYQELQRVVELDPNHYEAMGKLGEMYVAAGNTTDASGIADNLVKSRPDDPEGYILKSGLAVRAGKVDEAIEYLKKAAVLDPKRIRPMLTIGNLYLLKRDHRNALQWYDKALGADPEEPEVHVARGNFFIATGARDEGEKEFRRAIGLSKDKETLRIALAEHYLFQGRMEDSEQELISVIREMNSQKARKVLAEIKLESRKVDEAKPIVDAIIKENTKDLDGKYLLGRIALEEKRLDDAKAMFAEVVKQDASMARARLYNGVTELMLGQVETGKKEIAEAVRLEPGNAKARLMLGNVYIKSGAPAAAEKEALEVLKRNPSNLQAALLYGDSFLFRKDWKKAEQVYGAIMKQMPKNPVGYLKMGISRKFQKKPKEAADFFSRALERNQKDLGAINEYVFALAAAKNVKKAQRVVEDSLAQEPKNPLLWEMAGRFHLAIRKPDEAERAFLKAIDLAQEFSQPYYELGLLYVAQKKLTEAEAKFRKVIDKNDKNVGAHILLGVVLNSQEKIEEANQQYRRVLEMSPKNALAANNLAANLSEHGGNIDEALKFAQIAREAAPEDPSVGDTLGWIYFKKGMVDTAYPLIEEAAKKLEKNPVVRFHLGMVLDTKGMKKEAVRELKAALSISSSFPGAEDAKKKLETLR